MATTALAVLRQQLSGYHQILAQTMDDCPADALDRTLPGATVGTIASVNATFCTPTNPVSTIVSNVLAWHAAEHNGELAALKGAFGLKGLPF